jgi:hypothetical protein
MPNVNLSPYTAESEAIANRMRMAQLIGQQSMQPMEMPQQPGARFSPYQGLAKMLQAYTSVIGQEKALEQQKELQNRIGTEATDWIANYSSGIKGTPNTPEQTYKPGEADYREMGMMGKDLQVNPQGMAVEPAQMGIPTRARTAEEQQAYLGQGMKNPLTSAMASALLSKNIENQNFQNILKSAGMGNAPTAPMGGASAAPTGGMQPIGGGITGNINPNILAMSGDPRAIELAKYLSSQNKIKNFDVEIIDKVPTRVGLTESGNKTIIGPVEQALSPDTAARLKQEKEQADRAFTQLSANQKATLANDAARLNISAQTLFFDTGIKAGGGTFVNPFAQPPAQPNVAPTQPPVVPTQPNAQRPPVAGAVPTSAPVNAPTGGAYTPLSQLSPKAQQQMAMESMQAQQKKERGMQGIGETIDQAKNILQGKTFNEKGEQVKAPLPTQSYGGVATDFISGIFGGSPKGSAEADRLKVLGGSLVMAMPRMEGPQSDRDVSLYREMAGQVGDSSLSVARRLAALDQVEKLYRKYDKTSVENLLEKYK